MGGLECDVNLIKIRNFRYRDQIVKGFVVGGVVASSLVER